MQIKEINNKEEWEEFLHNCAEKTFLQSWNWGEFNLAMKNKIRPSSMTVKKFRSEINNKEEWEEFLHNCAEKTFLQSWNWGELILAMKNKIRPSSMTVKKF